MNKYQQNQFLFITLGFSAFYLMWTYWESPFADPTVITKETEEDLRVVGIDELRTIKDPAMRLLKARRLLYVQQAQMEEARAKLTLSLEARGQPDGFKGSRQDYENANAAIDRQADEVKQIIKELEGVVSVVITP